MKKESLIFSSVVSIVLAGLSVIPAFPIAEDNADSFSSSQTNDSLSIYNTTNDDKSKDLPEITDALTDSENASSDKIEDGEIPFKVFDIYNAHVASVEPPNIYLMSKGIDVSQWQAVKDSGVDFAIIRAGYGKLVSQKDPTFDYNVQNAQRVGLNCGTYWYSYALTVEDAQAEAEACYEIIKNYDFNYPVYFDIEDPSQSHLSASQISAIIETFCTTLQEKGCYVGIYSYANFLTTHVFETVLKKYDVWVAHFDVMQPDFNGEYGMWQYSSTGSVNGINGNVDMDYSYINYPYLISPETYTPPTSTTALANSSATTSTTTTTTTYVDNKIIAKGMNVSAWQGDIDWQAAKDGGIDYAIIRAGYGKFASQKDEKFDQNVLGAKSAGVDCGAYWYSYAVTVEEALQEAELFYETIKDYQFEYPVYFNIEDPIFSDLSVEEITAITEAFCSFMESKGYYVGIMSYVNFLNNRIDPSVFDKYDVSAAHYGVKAPDFSRFYGLWNYTNTGSADGVEGYVYLSNCYDYYPYIMTSNHLNGF